VKEMRMSVTEMPFTRMTEAEWQTRLDLAACYRLVDLFGWSDLINTRITARVPGPHDHFLINPYGLLFEEVTASSLVKIDAEGNKVEPSDCEINSGGFAIPSAAAPPDLRAAHQFPDRAARHRTAALDPYSIAQRRRHRSAGRRPRRCVDASDPATRRLIRSARQTPFFLQATMLSRRAGRVTVRDNLMTQASAAGYGLLQKCPQKIYQ
jgi:hypothetical protein